jgi:MscS family membrane protein
LGRDSPQSCVYSFLESCHSRNYARACKYLDLRKLPVDQRVQAGPQLAQQLAQILDRDARFDVAALSRDPEGDREDGLVMDRERVDSFTVGGKTLELQLERMTLRSKLSVWLFSSDTVALIPQLALVLNGSPIEKHLPVLLVNWKLMDTPLWCWIALVLLAAALTSLSGLLSRLALRLGEPILKRIAPKIDSHVLEVFAGPLRLLLSVTVFRATMESLDLSALLRLWLTRALALLFFTGIAWLGMGIVDLAISRLRFAIAVKHQTFAHSVLPLFSRVFKITIVILAITAILSNWGYNTTTILAGLGIGGVAIALAAQKTIENLFGGVAVISDHPVSVGDFCKFGDRVGTIEDIGLRSTRIRTPDRTLVNVPNAQFSSMTLENFSKRDKTLFHLTLNLQRDTMPDQVRTLLESISNILREHPKVETGNLPVRFVGVGTYSLDLEVFVYILTRSGDEFLTIQQDLLLWILDAVEAAGTALALPTQASINYSYGKTPSPNGATKPQEAAPANRR